MKKEVYQNAILKSRCIEACNDTNYLFVSGASNEVGYKGIGFLVEHDMEFRNKLIDLLTETQKRLQKEFDEL